MNTSLSLVCAAEWLRLYKEMRWGQDAGLCVAELVESSQAQLRPMGTHMDQLFSGCRGWPMEWASGTLDVPTLFWR